MAVPTRNRHRRRHGCDDGTARLRVGSFDGVAQNENLLRFMGSFCLLFRSTGFAAGRLWRRRGLGDLPLPRRRGSAGAHAAPTFTGIGAERERHGRPPSYSFKPTAPRMRTRTRSPSRSRTSPPGPRSTRATGALSGTPATKDVGTYSAASRSRRPTVMPSRRCLHSRSPWRRLLRPTVSRCRGRRRRRTPTVRRSPIFRVTRFTTARRAKSYSDSVAVDNAGLTTLLGRLRCRRARSTSP